MYILWAIAVLFYVSTGKMLHLVLDDNISRFSDFLNFTKNRSLQLQRKDSKNTQLREVHCTFDAWHHPKCNIKVYQSLIFEERKAVILLVLYEPFWRPVAMGVWKPWRSLALPGGSLAHDLLFVSLFIQILMNYFLFKASTPDDPREVVEYRIKRVSHQSAIQNSVDY